MRGYALGLYEKAMPSSLSWREKLAFAKKAEYDFVEISIDETEEKLARLDWSAEERTQLLDEMRFVGLPIRSMCLSGHRKYPLGDPDSAVRERSLSIMERAIRLADDLGIRIIQLAGYDVYYKESSPETKALFLDSLRQSVELAARHGVLLGFETMETDFLNTVWKAMYYVNCVSSPYLGVYPDIGNLNNAAIAGKSDVLADLASGQGHIFALHLKPTKPGQFRDLYFDDPAQQVDFAAAIHTAWGLGVRRYVTELWCLDRPDWKTNIMTACASMRALLDKEDRTHEG